MTRNDPEIIILCKQSGIAERVDQIIHIIHIRFYIKVCPSLIHLQAT
jgi:hypothetical protein